MITLEIYILTEEQEKLQDAAIEFDYDDNQTLEEHTFFNIDFIRPYKDNRCLIYSGGEEMITNKSYKEVRTELERQRTFRFN